MRTTPILQLPYPEATDSADVPRDIQALAEKLDSPSGASGVFIVGEIRFIAIVATPAGWLPCDGAAKSRTTYAALFAAIATVFGAGDGSTTFNVPDCRGRALAGAGQGTGLTNRAVGTKWGVEAVVLSTAQLPSHAHGGATGVDSPDHVHAPNVAPGQTGLVGATGASPDIGLVGGGTYGVINRTLPATNGASARHAHGITAEGGGQGHDNTSPSIAIPAYIYAGV